MTIEFRIFIAAPSEVEEQRKAMFEGLSRDSALTEEQRKEVAAGAGLAWRASCRSWPRTGQPPRTDKVLAGSRERLEHPLAGPCRG